MKKILLSTGIALALLVLLNLFGSVLASEDIYGLRIENISQNGADFSWSTSIETKGSVEYAYTKLPELYNPQSSGNSQNVLVIVVPSQTRSEDNYVKDHHVKVDNLDVNYDPFVQYTIKSETFDGDVYTLSGEFVLTNTPEIRWWQNWQFAVFVPILTLILGLALTPLTSRLWDKLFRKKIITPVHRGGLKRN